MELIDKIIAKFDDLLRYFAPGVIGLILVAVLRDDVSLGDIGTSLGVNLYILLALMLLSGVVIYAVHRYILVWVLWVLVMYFRRKINAYPPLPEKWRTEPLRRVMFELDMQRILRGASTDSIVQGVSRHHARWSSLQHYLYTTSYLCLALPFLVDQFKPGHIVQSHVWPCFFTGIFALLAALISEYRNTSLDIWASTRFQDGKYSDAGT